MLLSLAVVLVLSLLSYAMLVDSPTKFSRNKNEILRTLDLEIHRANKKDNLSSHCMKNSAVNDLRIGCIDGTVTRLRHGTTLQGAEKLH